MLRRENPVPYAARWALLSLIPLVWCAAAWLGWLNFLEDKLIDWRFRWRGELSAPLKIVYVDIDSTSLDEIGGWPWSRGYFAETAKALLDEAHVKAIGVDVVFSDLGQSEAADLRRQREGNRALRAFLLGGGPAGRPPVVLAASFSAERFRDSRGVKTLRFLPLLHRGDLDLSKIEPPEVPTLEFDGGILYTPPEVGLIDTIDGDTRWVPLFAPTSLRNYPHMALELARLYYGVPPEGVLVGDKSVRLVDARGKCLAEIPLWKRQLFEVNWHSAWRSPHNPRISFSSVYNHALLLKSRNPDPEKRKAEIDTAKAFFAQPDWRDAVVLIGPADAMLGDLGRNPFDPEPVPKVGIHGDILKTIVSGRYLQRPPLWGGLPWAEVLLVFAVGLSFAMLVGRGGSRVLLVKLPAFVFISTYAVLAFALFKYWNWVLPLAAPFGAAFTTAFCALIWQIWDEEKEKRRIRDLFGTYLSPAVVEQLIDSGVQPELGGHDAEITAFFSDVQDFSSFAEELDASRLAKLLNEYLGECTEIVQGEGGTLDKYIGDALVAMYGAPAPMENHAARACVSAILMQKKIAELRSRWAADSHPWPRPVLAMRARIGLNTGVSMIGNMGSRNRFNYTMMGDSVNLASRMESGAKHWGVYTLCTEATRSACETRAPGRIAFRSLGRIVVRGRAAPVGIHEIVGFADELGSEMKECLELFDVAMAKMYAQDWASALTLFQRSAVLEALQPGRDLGITTNPSLVRMERTLYYRHSPPEPYWDGVETMEDR